MSLQTKEVSVPWSDILCLACLDILQTEFGLMANSNTTHLARYSYTHSKRLKVYCCDIKAVTKDYSIAEKTCAYRLDSNPVCPDKYPMFQTLCQRVDSLPQLSDIEYMPSIKGWSGRSLHSLFSRKSSFMMTQTHFRQSKVQSWTSPHLTTWKSQQRNEAFPPIVGFEPVSRDKNPTEPKESILWRSCQRLNIYLQPM